MSEIKEKARKAWQDQAQSQEVHGGAPCSKSYIAGFMEGFKESDSRLRNPPMIIGEDGVARKLSDHSLIKEARDIISEMLRYELTDGDENSVRNWLDKTGNIK